MSDTLLPVEREIYEALQGRVREFRAIKPGSDSVWTAGLKQVLYGLGEARQLQAWGTSSEHGAEWLWDVCWIKVGRGWTDFRGVFLACEIEWKISRKALLEDFLKLVAAKADYRLFVFQASSVKSAEKRFEELMNVCPGSEGARYLALAFVRDCDPLPYRAWTI